MVYLTGQVQVKTDKTNTHYSPVVSVFVYSNCETPCPHRPMAETTAKVLPKVPLFIMNVNTPSTLDLSPFVEIFYVHLHLTLVFFLLAVSDIPPRATVNHTTLKSPRGWILYLGITHSIIGYYIRNQGFPDYFIAEETTWNQYLLLWSLLFNWIDHEICVRIWVN